MAENKTIKDWLASMNTPSFGLHLTWGKEEQDHTFLHSRTFYPFNITGIEAVNSKAFDALRKAILSVGGTITTWQIEDIDA